MGSNRVSKLRFPPPGSFHMELKRRVDEYFRRTGLQPQGGRALHVKGAIMLVWLASSYLLLMLAAPNVWQGALLSVSLGLAVAGLGFNVMHDANHGAYSRNPRVNRILGYSLDLIGGSSYLWRHKHNVLHHTYTNISGLDTDGDVGPVLRLNPSQPRLPVHRWQHLYAWLLYAVYTLKWWFFDDFRELITGRIGGNPYPRPGRADLAGALLGKAVFFTWAFVLPVIVHPTWWLLGVWVLASATTGIVLAAVFMLAHCLGEVEHQDAAAGAHEEWAIHQVRTTSDFAHGSRLIRWYVGGLNYQVEHHLFTRICHIHYPALAEIVEQVCREHGVRYRSQPTMRAALAANLRYLRALGRSQAVVA